MAYILPDKIRNLIPYEPVSGEYPVRLDANESFLSPDHCPELAKTIQRALSAVLLNRYPDPAAHGPCRAFSSLYQIPEECLTAGNGSDELISLICGALLPKGGKVLTLTPDFSMYRFYGEIIELQNVVLPKLPSLKIDPDAVLEVISREKIDLLIFSNPCNPTSLLLGRDGVLRLLEAPCLVVVDEAYMEFCAEDQSVMDQAVQRENLIVLKTCSKAIGMAGARLGFAAAGRTVTRALRAAKSPYNVNALTQAVGEAVLSRPDLLKDCRQKLVSSRKALERALREDFSGFSQIREIFPSQTNFVFLKVRDAAGTYEALKREGIMIWHMGENLRVTAGSPAENRRFLEALSQIWRSEK